MGSILTFRLLRRLARMVELVDTLRSNRSAERLGGSTPSTGMRFVGHAYDLWDVWV